MIQRKKPAWLAMAAAFLCVATACVAERQVSEPQTVAVSAPAGPYSQLSNDVWGLASEGKLDDVWTRVRALTKADDQANPAVSTLTRDLARHDVLETGRRAKDQEQYDKAMGEMRKFAAEDKLVDALTAAVQATDVIDDPMKVINDPQVQTLEKKAADAAAGFEKQGRWTRALALYQRLSLLYDDRNTYADQVKRVSQHVSLLGLYAPEVLFELYKKDAAERGDPEPEPWAMDADRWQTQLQDIDSMLLTDSLLRAQSRHVEGATYKQLVTGGIDGLRVFFDTRGLEEAFPTLKDAAKVKTFTDFLDETRNTIDKRELPMGLADTTSTLTRIMKMNEDTVQLPEKVIVHEFGNGAMRTLDEFTAIIWPHAKMQFDKAITGNFSGVGIQITLVNRQLTVVTPLEDTPALKAGIKPGDQIVTIDGKSTVGIGLDQAVDKITGEQGSQVKLGIKTPSTDKTREVTLTRSSIKVVSVKGWERLPGGDWNCYVDKADRIGYVRVTNFGPNTADEIDAQVKPMIEGDGLNGLIIDLRMNPGGRLDAAIDVSNRFLDKGTIVSTTQKMLTGDEWKADADESHTYPNVPVIVMVNGSSASASEIVSGCLQAHHRALIVGQRSFGKGSVQHLFRIGFDKAYLKLTTQYYKLPDGRIIHRRPGAEMWGIEPDVKVRMSDRQTAAILRARTYLDILREKGEKIDPKQFLNDAAAEKKDDKNADPADAEEAKEEPLASVSEILTRGMDPQLETALLLLKTRVLNQVATAALPLDKARADKATQ
ncbi:MAG: PDZ domain-containing protein [Phycisphaera sp.]|nr:PDZ domain-containing protein [Phycisphaera sp.]